MSLFLLLLLLGVANWFATTLLVESEIFRPLRQWVEHRYDKSNGPVSAGIWSKVHYMVGCHMCAGTWVALAMALFVPPVVGVPVAGWLLTALVIKGIGHLVLLLSNLGNARTELDRAKAIEASMNALPDLESMLGGLMNRHEARVDASQNGNGRRKEEPLPKTMFGDQGRMPTKNGGKFEPFDAAREPGYNLPESRF